MMLMMIPMMLLLSIMMHGGQIEYRWCWWRWSSRYFLFIMMVMVITVTLVLIIRIFMIMVQVIWNRNPWGLRTDFSFFQEAMMPNLPISRPLQDRDFQNLPLLFLFLKDPGKPRTEPCHPSMSGSESLLLQHQHHHHHLLLLLLLLALVTLPLPLLLFLLLLLPLHQVIYMKFCRAE